MPDISMCDDKQCPSRNECYRFRAKPSQYRQSYFVDTGRGDRDKCEYFTAIKYPDEYLEPIVDE